MAKGAGRWRVMGHDAFSREDYVLAAFPTEEEARAYVRAKERATEATQDEGLRDVFWVLPPDAD